MTSYLKESPTVKSSFNFAVISGGGGINAYIPETPINLSNPWLELNKPKCWTKNIF